MTPVEIGNLAGLLGSALLAYPAFRLSRYLRHISRVENLVHDNRDSEDPGRKLLEAMETHVSRWNPLDHYLLLIGFALLALSFAIPLFS